MFFYVSLKNLTVEKEVNVLNLQQYIKYDKVPGRGIYEFLNVFGK